jgi:hypothetical protein
VELEEGFAEPPFVMDDGRNLAARFPNPVFVEMFRLQGRMKVHVFPGWFQPVAIQIAGLVAGGEKAADPLIIGGVLIRTKTARQE